MYSPDDYPDDVPHPDSLCICKHKIRDHTPRNCKHEDCKCTYPREVVTNE